MSIEPIDLADVLAHRYTTPAPWPATTQPYALEDAIAAAAGVWPHNPDVFPVATDPAQPEPATTDELLAACRQIRTDLAVAVARSRQARGADRDDLGQVA